MHHVEENEDAAVDHLISVHSTFVLAGYVACGISAAFAVILVLLSPGPIGPDGALRFISEGIQVHCGFANSVMGTCSLCMLACQMVLAAVHSKATILVACALVQMLSWNIVLGAQDTGWTVHDVALVCFIFSNVLFHAIMAQHPVFGGPVYRLINALAWLFGAMFGGLGLASSLTGSSVAVLKSFAVAFEFVFMLSLSAQNVCVVSALDQFQGIHLRLERWGCCYYGPA